MRERSSGCCALCSRTLPPVSPPRCARCWRGWRTTHQSHKENKQKVWRTPTKTLTSHLFEYLYVIFNLFSNFTAESENQNSTTSKEDEEDEKVLNAAADGDSSSSPSSMPYSCRWCKKGFAYKCRRLAHVKRCPMSQEHKCPQCPTKLPNLRALQRHKATAHCDAASTKKKAACDLCGRTFAHSSGEDVPGCDTGGSEHLVCSNLMRCLCVFRHDLPQAHRAL